MQDRNQILCKKHGCFFKMVDIDNNKLMRLLITAGGSLLLSQKQIKKREKQRIRKIRERDNKGVYYSIIHDLSLTDKEDFRKYLRIHWQPLYLMAAYTFILFK